MTSQSELETLHTPQEVAVIFKVRVQTVRGWLRDNKFPNARRINGQWRIPHRDVVAMANGNHG